MVPATSTGSVVLFSGVDLFSDPKHILVPFHIRLPRISSPVHRIRMWTSGTNNNFSPNREASYERLFSFFFPLWVRVLIIYIPFS